jgi:hypothetical protein
MPGSLDIHELCKCPYVFKLTHYLVVSGNAGVQSDAKHFRWFLALAENPGRFCCFRCPFGGHFRVFDAQGFKLSFSAISIQHTLCRIQERPGPRQRRAVVPGHPIRRCLLQLLGVPL